MAAILEEPNTFKSTTQTFQPGKYLSFRLGVEMYGISVKNIREIIRMQQITPVPHKPDYVRGIMNLRGKVIPVIDMRLKFALGKETFDERTCIVVVMVQDNEQQESTAGLIVDAVDEVMRIREEDFESDPAVGNTRTTAQVIGLAKTKGNLISLLDIDQVVVHESF
ncbi:MAG: chemotaxis protein CheW [Verrucomicrobiota bacterium]